jgi:hypothetical protein
MVWFGVNGGLSGSKRELTPSTYNQPRALTFFFWFIQLCTSTLPEPLGGPTLLYRIHLSSPSDSTLRGGVYAWMPQQPVRRWS